ncbi:hypothetical protein HBH70_123740 [Parastagonospora nodorum]|nr:hypothetical protein HBH52_084140 [Parastagonospora nodorum]KAH4026931.1 hypothetical protein HBI09_145970 [Parastagonospora nodorum]KAH4088589.1 hypothetical protein HBH46_195130 [Parastagonospora nodorum]KAH4302038.1 hypothetical protein HBI01_099510 [Parastagonospora nodorum]KAH4306682.1 hypothetical protein HBI02_119880 [Parastagonospora nodorum]
MQHPRKTSKALTLTRTLQTCSYCTSYIGSEPHEGIRQPCNTLYLGSLSAALPQQTLKDFRPYGTSRSISTAMEKQLLQWA